ncbi:MBL fold metallo-hydrolase [Anaerosphaera multitolerans]|uniref:MBL fold metallo-hydrolase n=1 Tax=Anaerosphaera multitolerans TaxID=2487351 RepID=A0A437S7E6_9FIRM|nr:MBL fold metallo-hydrolase [Anaerosphaera multitolerans]RVU54858.1 MBL fold metallo-hydrolase [Anaerosphaera multitolerans]
MKIEVLSSGSKGNCYKVSDGETALLIECGITINEIKKKLSFDFSDIEGCLVTHEHIDHAKAVKDLMKLGIDCYMTAGTAEALNISGHNVKIFRGHWEDPRMNCTQQVNYTTKRVGNYFIKPFQVVHDAYEPCGFLIDSVKSGETLLFITDTMYSKYQFKVIDYIMLEVNYVKEVINDNRLHPGLRKRIKENHMSLETALTFLKSCDLSRTKEIYIMHLSDNNSDEKFIKEEIQKATGKPVYIC